MSSSQHSDEEGGPEYHEIEDHEYSEGLDQKKIKPENYNSKDEITFKRTLYEVTMQSLPSVFGLICENLVQVINLIFVGHLNDPIALGGVGLGNLLINITCFSVAMGLNGAIDTLVSQAYGNREYYLCGCYLNRGRIVQVIFFIPSLIVCIYTREFLMLLGQDYASSEAARVYIVTLLPGMFAMAQFETVRRYLQGMGIFNLTMYIQCITMALHLLWSYLLVFYFELGITGSSIATCITFWLNLIIVTVILCYKKDIVHEESWHFFNRDSFKHLWQYLKMGIPAALMLCLEWWTFEIISLFAGWLSPEELAANVVLFNLIAFLFQFPFGMSFAISNLIGNSLGEGKPRVAKSFFKVSFYVIVVLSVILIAILVSLRDYLPLMYTQEEEVVKLISATIPVFTIMLLFDYTQGVMSGCIRGIGYQHYGSVISLVSYWVIMLPVCYILGFVLNLRLLGLWLGVPFGSFITFCSLMLILLCVNWNKLSEDAIKRVQYEKSKIQGNKQLTERLLNENTNISD